MNVHEYINKMKTLQMSILNYIDDDYNIEENYCHLQQTFLNQKIRDNKNNFQIFLLLLAKVIDNHHRNLNFYEKIEKIINLLKKEILLNFSNNEIFDLFSSNKRIILFLLKENILKIDKKIKKYMQNQDEYFFIELLSINEGELSMSEENKETLKSFEMKRQIGENDDYICKLIRNDSIDQFISFVNQKDLPLTSYIQPSIFETNKFLIDKNVTLIEYAAFFGSAQIVKYLYKNFVKMTSQLWIYAIHSNNPELIQLLEENKIIPENKSYLKCLIESIKCHHNDMADYIENNLLSEKVNTFSKVIKYFNFVFFEKYLDIVDCIDYANHFIKYNYNLFIILILQNNAEKKNQI